MVKYKYDLIEGCPNISEDEISYQEYYRVSKNDDLTDEDFLPQYWSEPERRKAFIAKGTVCGNQGMSCFSSYKEAKNIARRYKLGEYIYKGACLEKYATIKDIGHDKYPTHANAYMYAGFSETNDIRWELIDEN